MANNKALIAIYPGSFDPLTNGHLDLIRRSAKLVDRLIVAVLNNTSKQPLFPTVERKAMISEATAGLAHVEVDSFEGLLVDYAEQRGAQAILRGIRAISDYESEMQMALLNRHLRPGTETVFLMAAEEYSFISSRMIKEVIKLGGDVSQFVPAAVAHRLSGAFNNKGVAVQRTAMQATAEIAERISTISVSSTMKVAADAERLRREGSDVVDFGPGEPDFPTPDNIKQAAVRALDANYTKYTNTGGAQDLREAICERHKLDFGTAYTPTECMATVGGKHAIFNLMQALIDPGDEVIIPVPYWVTYKDVVNYAGGVCVFVETDEAKGFEVSAALIEKHLTPKTKLVIINSPSNPSGGVLSQEEFRAIYKLTSKREIMLMTDECYCQFLYDDKPFSIAAEPGAKDYVVVAGSLSKTYAMTGWRVGFALAPAPIIGAMMKLQSHSTSNPTSIAQKAAIEALRGSQASVPQMLAEYRTRRDFVIDRLRQIPDVFLTTPKGAFYAYPNISVAYKAGKVKNSLDFANKLLTDSLVAVVPGEAFGTNDHIRISYATSMHELERGLDRLHKFIDTCRA